MDYTKLYADTDKDLNELVKTVSHFSKDIYRDIIGLENVS